jgi:hypothetical protein
VIGPPVSVTSCAAHEALGRVHRDGAHGVFAKVLRHLENQALAVVVGFQRVQDLGQVVVELHVDDGADDLRDFAFCFAMCRVSGSVLERFGARNDFDQLVGDDGLARAVVLDGQRSIISPALRVALSIADIRAPCSDAPFSSSAVKICVATPRGRRSARIASSDGS